MRAWPILLVAVTAASSFASPQGRVVKIERRRESTIPRMCIITGETKGLCIGQPDANERMTLIDALGGVLGEVKISGATEEKAVGLCGPNGKSYLYKVSLERMSGSASRRRTKSVVGIRGMRIDSRTQALKEHPSPSGDPNQQVMLALDTDADSSADIVVTTYACDGSGMALGDKPTCMDTYLRQGTKRLERVHQERLELCK